MADVLDLRELASALRELHRALLERARRDYERGRGSAVAPAELLRLLTTDPHFEWLRGLSELMVDLDVLAEGLPDAGSLGGTVRAAVEHFISAPGASGPTHAFAEHYWPAVQEDPHVAMAHAGVKRAIEHLPRADKTDAASLLHERHVLAEKARHRRRLH